MTTVNPSPPVRLLFIGNSHTYLHYMPQMLAALAAAAGGLAPLQAEQVTGQGASLKWHWHNPDTRALLVKNRWDYGVLQDRSGGPLEAVADLREYGQRLAGEIRKQGAETIFFMTWAHRRRPETQPLINDAYRRLADETGALLAPVGAAWAAALAADAGLRLHHDDDRHANPAGAYLSACVFYAVVCPAGPETLPGNLRDKDRQLIDLSAQRARFLQRVAFETVQRFR